MKTLPCDWTIKPLKDLAQYKAGRTPSRVNSTYWKKESNNIPWVAISDMKNYGLVKATSETITLSAYRQIFRGQIVPSGTLIMSFKLTIGRVAWLQIDACHNEAIIAIYPNNNVDQRYLGYFLSQVDYTAYQDRQVKGNTLNQEKINRILIALPPLSEQSIIASVLDEVRSAITFEKKAQELMLQLKDTIMQKLFTQGLRGERKKKTTLGSIPESWNVSTLESIAKLERGRFLHRPRNEPRFYGGTTPFVQTGDIVRSSGRIREYTQTLNADGVVISRVFPAGTILITIAANIGYTGILEFDAACPDSLVAIQPNNSINTFFLEYFLQTQQQIMDRQALKGTQKNINIQFLNPWPIPIPSLSEQLEIVSMLKIIDEKIDLHNRKLFILNDLFKTLLHKLMTGEIRVAELDLSALDRSADVEGSAV